MDGWLCWMRNVYNFYHLPAACSLIWCLSRQLCLPAIVCLPTYLTLFSFVFSENALETRLTLYWNAFLWFDKIPRNLQQEECREGVSRGEWRLGRRVFRFRLEGWSKSNGRSVRLLKQAKPKSEGWDTGWDIFSSSYLWQFECSEGRPRQIQIVQKTI